MSKAGRAAKRRVRYDGNPPKCGNCRHFKKAATGLRDSLPVRLTPPICSLNVFIVSPGGVCDTWCGLDGSKLE